jgi:Flp pilus assembly protein TadD
MGRFEEAILQFRAALKLQPELVQARINLGIALVSLSRFPEAEKELQEAARLAPNDPEVAFNLGAAYVSARKTPEGIRELRRSLSLRPNFTEARERLGTALFYEGKLEEATREFGEALKTRPESADAHFGLGLIHSEEGRTEEAIREYERALQGEPNHSAASTNLALLYGRSGKAPFRAQNRVAAFELYRRAILAKNWSAAWETLSERTRALYLNDSSRFRYAAQKAFENPGIRDKLAAPGFFLPYLEPPSPDPSSGLPYDPSRLGAIREGVSGDWKVDFLVLSGFPGPDPER